MSELIVDPQAGPVGVGVGEEAGKQHLVRARTDPRHEVVRFESRLLDLGLKISRVAVQRQPVRSSDPWLSECASPLTNMYWGPA